MTITPERLAAYADGELDDAEARLVEGELERSPALRAQLAAHRKLRALLAARFAPTLEQPVPERLSAAIRASSLEAEVIDLERARKQRRSATIPARWWWIAGPAVAASVALIVLTPHSDQTGYASQDLTTVLDRQLVATQGADASVRILLSFRDRAGRYCRGYAGQSVAGYACRDDNGWRIGKELATAGGSSGEYRQAGAPPAALMAAIQERAAGPALDAAEERQARTAGWR